MVTSLYSLSPNFHIDNIIENPKNHRKSESLQEIIFKRWYLIENIIYVTQNFHYFFIFLRLRYSK